MATDIPLVSKITALQEARESLIEKQAALVAAKADFETARKLVADLHEACKSDFDEFLGPEVTEEAHHVTPAPIEPVKQRPIFRASQRRTSILTFLAEQTVEVRTKAITEALGEAYHNVYVDLQTLETSSFVQRNGSTWRITSAGRAAIAPNAD